MALDVQALAAANAIMFYKSQYEADLARGDTSNLEFYSQKATENRNWLSSHGYGDAAAALGYSTANAQQAAAYIDQVFAPQLLAASGLPTASDLVPGPPLPGRDATPAYPGYTPSPDPRDGGAPMPAPSPAPGPDSGSTWAMFWKALPWVAGLAGVGLLKSLFK